MKLIIFFLYIHLYKCLTNQISINNLSKVYDNGFKALNNVSLKVKQGEILAMLGPNGAGKTSLISIICGIVKPSSGTVLQ